MLCNHWVTRRLGHRSRLRPGTADTLEAEMRRRQRDAEQNCQTQRSKTPELRGEQVTVRRIHGVLRLNLKTNRLKLKEAHTLFRTGVKHVFRIKRGTQNGTV
jgi:hypothetical protein